MKLPKRFAAAALLGALVCGQAMAEPDYAYVYVEVPANTDVILSAPVNNTVEAEVTSNSVAGAVINLPSSLTPSAFNKGSFAKYYVRFIDGPAAGLWASIESNTASSITVESAYTDILAKATPGGGDTVKIYKHLLVPDVFPDNMEGIMFNAGTTTIFLPDNEVVATNKAANLGGSGAFSSLFKNWGALEQAPILPDTTFTLRNNSGDTLQYMAAGLAPDHPVSFLVNGSVEKDSALSTGYPLGVLVPDTNLGAAGGTRTIFLPDNAASGFNKAANLGGSGNFSSLFGNWGAITGSTILPNSGFTFRQSSGVPEGVFTVTKPY